MVIRVLHLLSFKIKKNLNWSVPVEFSIVAENNKANLEMLHKIQQFFGVGKIRSSNKPNIIRFIVRRQQDCLLIRNHFTTYPLLTYKLVHFKLWCIVLDLIIDKNIIMKIFY
jgi:LAGLIDADG endonuclease